MAQISLNHFYLKTRHDGKKKKRALPISCTVPIHSMLIEFVLVFLHFLATVMFKIVKLEQQMHKRNGMNGPIQGTK